MSCKDTDLVARPILPENPPQFILQPTDPEAAMRIIKQQVMDFQKSLDAQHDVAFVFTSFNYHQTMVVNNVSLTGSNFIIFTGQIDGMESRLIQHISQLNFALIAIPVKTKQHRMGFEVNLES